jgi:hypothetical protein
VYKLFHENGGILKLNSVESEQNVELEEPLSAAKIEDDERIQQLADEHQVAVISFVAPYIGVKVTPVRMVTAQY